MTSAVDLSKFDNRDFDRGAPALKEAMWLFLRQALFLAYPLRGYALKRRMLKLFGASLGTDVIIKPRVSISHPWRLSVGAHSWIGEDALLLSLDRISIGEHCCISQRAFLCTGSHDWSDPRFGLLTRPITIGNGVWICANVFIGPGVTIGDNAVVTAGSIVTRDLPEGMICSGNPCEPVKARP